MTPLQSTTIKEFRLCHQRQTFVYRYAAGREMEVADLLDEQCYSGLISFAKFREGLAKLWPVDDASWR